MRGQFLAGLAYCFYVSWALLCSLGPGIVLAGGLSFAQATSFPSWLGPLVCIALASVAVAAHYRRTRRIFEGPRRLVVLACIMAATAVFHAVWILDGEGANWLAYIISSVLFGVGGASCRIEIARLFGWIGAQQAIFQGIIGTFLASAVLLVLSWLPGYCLFIGAFLSGALAVAFLWLGIKGLPHARFYRHGSDASLYVPFKFMGTCFVQGCAMGIIYIWLFLIGLGTLSESWHFLASVLALVALSASMVFLRLDFNRLIYKVAFPLIAAGFLLLVFVRAEAPVGFLVLLLGFCYLDLVLWSLSSYLVKNMGLPAPWTASCPGAALYFGILAGSLVSLGFAADILANPHDFSDLGAVVACVVLAVALFLSSSTNLKYGWGTVRPGDNGLSEDAFDSVVQLLSREYALTNRESEVFLFLAQGKSRRFMSDNLYVSADTVKTHVKNVYRKLSVHAQHELINLVEAEVEKFE